jgi:hypothetical protein
LSSNNVHGSATPIVSDVFVLDFDGVLLDSEPEVTPTVHDNALGAC